MFATAHAGSSEVLVWLQQPVSRSNSSSSNSNSSNSSSSTGYTQASVLQHSCPAVQLAWHRDASDQQDQLLSLDATGAARVWTERRSNSSNSSRSNSSSSSSCSSGQQQKQRLLFVEMARVEPALARSPALHAAAFLQRAHYGTQGRELVGSGGTAAGGSAALQHRRRASLLGTQQQGGPWLAGSCAADGSLRLWRLHEVALPDGCCKPEPVELASLPLSSLLISSSSSSSSSSCGTSSSRVVALSGIGYVHTGAPSEVQLIVQCAEADGSTAADLAVVSATLQQIGSSAKYCFDNVRILRVPVAAAAVAAVCSAVAHSSEPIYACTTGTSVSVYSYLNGGAHLLESGEGSYVPYALPPVPLTSSSSSSGSGSMSSSMEAAAAAATDSDERTAAAAATAAAQITQLMWLPHATGRDAAAPALCVLYADARLQLWQLRDASTADSSLTAEWEHRHNATAAAAARSRSGYASASRSPMRTAGTPDSSTSAVSTDWGLSHAAKRLQQELGNSSSSSDAQRAQRQAADAESDAVTAQQQQQQQQEVTLGLRLDHRHGLGLSLGTL
jgi:hypothetical protein